MNRTTLNKLTCAGEEMPAGYLYTELIQSSNALLSNNGAAASHYHSGDSSLGGSFRFSLKGAGMGSGLSGEEAIVELLEFVWRKFDRTDSDAFVKIKCLRLLKHLCESGHERIREFIRRKYIQKIKKAQSYRGPPHPLQGDAPSARVREEAMACLRALYAHESRDAAATAAAVEATRSRIEGFGSDEYCGAFPSYSSSSRLGGFGLQQQYGQQPQYHEDGVGGKGGRGAGGCSYASSSLSYVNSSSAGGSGSSSCSGAVWGAGTGGGVRPAMPGFGNPAFARQNSAAAATPGEQALLLISSTASKIIPAGMQQQLQRVVSAALPTGALQFPPSASSAGGHRGGGAGGDYGSSRGPWSTFERSSSSSSFGGPVYMNSGAGGTGSFYRAPPRPGACSSSSMTRVGGASGIGDWTPYGDAAAAAAGARSSATGSSCMAAASPSASPSNTAVSQGLPAGQYEARVVEAFLVPCGATLLPSAAVLRDFCCRCQSFDTPVLGGVIVDKLSDASLPTTSRLRLLAGCEALLKQEELQQQQMEEGGAAGGAAAAEGGTALKTYLQTHAKQLLLQCVEVPQLRKVATRVLLFLGETTDSGAPAEQQQQQTPGGAAAQGAGERRAKATAATDGLSLLDIAAGGEQTAAAESEQQRDLLDVVAPAAAVTATSSDDQELLLMDDFNSSSNSSSSTVADSHSAATLGAAAAAGLPRPAQVTSVNSIQHADDVNLVPAEAPQEHKNPFFSSSSLFSQEETTTADSSTFAARAAGKSSNSGSSDAATTQPLPLLAQLRKKKETRATGSVFSGLTVKRPAAADATTTTAGSAAAGSSTAAAPSSVAAARPAAVEPLDLLSPAASVNALKQQQHQQQPQLLSPLARVGTAANQDVIPLSSAAGPHRTSAAAALDVLSLGQTPSENIAGLCSTPTAAVSVDAAVPAAAAASSFFPSVPFGTPDLAAASSTSAMLQQQPQQQQQQQQQQGRSADTTSRTAHLDRFFGRFPPAAATGAAATLPSASDAEQQQQQQCSLAYTVQQQQAVIQRLQEQQQQMLLLLQQKQVHQENGYPALGFATAETVAASSSRFRGSPASSATLFDGATQGAAAGVGGLTMEEEGAAAGVPPVGSSLLLSMTDSNGSSFSSTPDRAARSATGGGGHTNSNSTFDGGAGAAATAAPAPRASKFAFVKS